MGAAASACARGRRWRRLRFNGWICVEMCSGHVARFRASEGARRCRCGRTRAECLEGCAMIWYVWLICVRRMLLRCFLSGGDSESSARVRRHTVLGCVEGCERLRARVGGRDVSLRRFVRWVYVLGDVAAGLDLQMWLHRSTTLADVFFTTFSDRFGEFRPRRTSFFHSYI